ncbi:zinc chelation protein SecC [Marinomonas ushuaiensis DSM 15871]|uniref:Zinc chelation protein SecC n=1 Tax=Marinomonas ushuaiensis DSM 15871 TaxID=1122207 RepID=X7E2J9_9GAMM|nr:SEC-C metal-binding domain-containing protein [Marinomonas ushuaiensis]ETX10187.1 zinc chelation protein SecC [Marinomonas ushuaiensis DSM 15871]
MVESNQTPMSEMPEPTQSSGCGCCAAPKSPVMRDAPKIGRNDPCICGNGRKFKKCCGKNS